MQTRDSDEPRQDRGGILKSIAGGIFWVVVGIPVMLIHWVAVKMRNW
jgi:hypothetical protein